MTQHQERSPLSISEFFNKKARATVAAAAIALGGAGGYAGHEIAQHQFQPQPSNFVLSQVNDSNMTESEFLKGQLRGGPVVTDKETAAMKDFNARIDQMASDRAWGNLGSARSEAVQFVNDLRTSQDISEQDYAKLLAQYNTRVGIDVSDVAGNYQKGIMYNQEAQAAVAISQIFGHDDMTPAETAKDVGDAMLEGQQMYDRAGLEGGLAGAALGMMLLLPGWIRSRKGPKGPKLS
jgi:hypothetical protein